MDMMKTEKTRRRLSLQTSDKVILGALGVLLLLIIALGIFQRCGLTPVKGELLLYLPVLTLFLLVGWGVYALIRRIKSRTVKLLVGGGAAILLLLVLVVAFTYISYIGFYVIPQRYTAMTSPSGAHRLLVMRTFDTDEQRIQTRKAARLEENPDSGEENSVEDWGYVYRAYPQVLGIFYRSNADVEGEVYLNIDGIPGDSESTETSEQTRGTLMVEWLEEEKVAHFFVENPGAAEGGECTLRF